jgi:hypothetical protein
MTGITARLAFTGYRYAYRSLEPLQTPQFGSVISNVSVGRTFVANAWPPGLAIGDRSRNARSPIDMSPEATTASAVPGLTHHIGVLKFHAIRKARSHQLLYRSDYVQSVP